MIIATFLVACVLPCKACESYGTMGIEVGSHGEEKEEASLRPKKNILSLFKREKLQLFRYEQGFQDNLCTTMS
jgi:hypothetical protein